ncbi:heterokaryon incompatibility protein-domain-containing protein [Bipolaris maydis]|nr:heterokaryon incompatibility protein-domain-containing protein [Bipolaris maydis]KAJ6276149.1 heterokaryon incompatibility protein-domain-containing protein [Bipolaris maydis]KAJ6287293.1 heterokaryon incompatibility protein-domain-containing protein [Bipolaris maydis]
MDMYHYTALESENSDFRLLKLLRGSGSELECELSPQSLQNLHLPYEALSYTWGSSELVECIKLNGKPFWITDNLYAALRNLQLHDRDRILWIDAICINQENKAEQSQQVQQMGQIYEKAEKLLIWLGKATPQIIALMETLSQFRNTDPDYHYKPETFKDWNWKDHSIAIKQLLNREWFTRVWILQEAAKAHRADVCCGVRSIPTEIFVLALSFVEQKFPPHCQPVLDIMAKSFRSSSWWAQTPNLHTLLHKFHGSKATDERDKIYALLDYQRPTSKVVHEAVAYLLQSTQTNQSNTFTMNDVLDIMCSFTTLDVTYFVSAQEISTEATSSNRPSGYETIEPYQAEIKFSGIAVVNDPTILLFEERPEESLEDQKTCYSQIVGLMPDQQSTRAVQDYDEALHILSWGNAGHHVKVAVISDKPKAILKAAMRGYDQVVRRLLHIKLGVAQEEECEALVLQKVVTRRLAGLLPFLLNTEIDVNAQGGEYGNALQAAASRSSNEEIVKILLNAGADVNAQGGYYGNALQSASATSRSKYRVRSKETVKMLLDAGADVNAQGGYYGNALQAAAYNGWYGIVEGLLDAGADVNAQGGEYGNALQAASRSGNEEIGKMLLNAGADVNGQGGYYGNALQAAKNNRPDTYRNPQTEMVVEMLLDAGADDTDQDGEQSWS